MAPRTFSYRRLYYAVLALFGVFMLIEYRYCYVGLDIRLFDTDTACRGADRVEVPLEDDATGVPRD